MSKQKESKTWLKVVGMFMLVVGLALLILNHLPVGPKGVIHLTGLFYMAMGVVYLKPAFLNQLYHSSLWGEFLVVTPAIIGLALVMLKSMGKLTFAMELDMLPIMLYGTAVVTSFGTRKKEKKDE